MPTEEECSKCKTNSGGIVYNVVIFLVLVLVIVLCGYNITAYTDIINGNVSAPDISNGTCIFMIIANTFIIILCAVGIWLTLKKGFNATKDSGKDYIEKMGVDNETVELYGQKGAYVANSWGVQWGLFVFSTIATIVTLFNVIQLTKISSSDNPDAVSPNGAFIFFNWFVFLLALVYWGYVSFRTLFKKKTQYYLITTFKNPVKSGFSEKLNPFKAPVVTATGLELPKNIASRNNCIKNIGKLTDTFTI